MNPQTGRRFGPYEIQSRLGGGGMGHVYRAWDARLHREVALKLLQSEFAMSGMRERFLREARAASALNHPNICTIFDIGEQDGDPYLVLELLEGETLRERIQNKTLQTEEICCIAKEVAEALGAAHAKGIIHRDVKPANIFLVDRPKSTVQAKVLDFGLAKIEGGVLGARSSRAMDITTEGSTVGTLAYMSPEQARGEMLDSRSDLFSLGVVLYEMATRHVPFPGATSALVFVKLLNEMPEPIREWNDSVPRDLEKIILKLMAKERAARFQTAQELVEALGHVNDKAGGGWLRKAVANVPLVRAPDPNVRGRRPARPRSEGRSYEDGGPAILRATPPPSSGEAHFLRPVVRLPREESSPRSSGSGPSGRLAAPSGAGPGAPPRVPPPNEEAAASATTVEPTAPLAPSSAAVPKPKDAAAASPSSAETAFGAPLFAEPEVAPAARRAAFTPIRIGLAVLSLAVLGSAALLFANRGRFQGATLAANEPVVVTEIENQTGDKTLDETVSTGLEIALAESPYLTLRSRAAYRTAHRQLEREISGRKGAFETARRLGASAYFVGRISGQTPPYRLHVELRRTASNDLITFADEQATSLQEVTGAIDRIASELRAACGEDSDSLGRNSGALAHEATANLDALHLYTQGEAALADDQTLEAMQFYQQAVALEPRFALALLRLSALYRKLRAEIEAGEAAKLALAAADGTSARVRALAQFEYEMNSSGDAVRATAILRQYLKAAPHDSVALEGLARALRQQGHMAEALQAAQQSYAEDPLNVDAYAQAENALIGLDRFDAAFQLEQQLGRTGLAQPGGTLIAAYLVDRADALASAVAPYSTQKEGFRPDWSYGIYLDNGGRLNAGAALWRLRAGEAEHISGVESAAGTLLAQGAIDRALAGDCPNGLALASESDGQQQGQTALFDAGMADALCGKAARAREIIAELRSMYPQSFAVVGFYLADLQAAIALSDRDPAAAIEYLKPARQYDLISLTPFLRGRAHVALRQTAIGIVDYQTALAHRGVPFLVGSNVYPIAEIGVARAFADTGDLGNSADAYRRFLSLWSEADAGQPLTAEARAHVH